MSRGRGRGTRGKGRDVWRGRDTGAVGPQDDGYDRDVSDWTGPPWEHPDWDETTGTLPRVRPGRQGGGHPSGPLPPADSGPLPPLPPPPAGRGRRAARPSPGAAGYPSSYPGQPRDDGYQAGDPGDGGYPAWTGYGQDPGYPAGSRGRDDARYRGGSGYSEGGYEPGDYPLDGASAAGGARHRGDYDGGYDPGFGGYPGGDAYVTGGYPDEEYAADAYPGESYPGEDYQGDDEYDYPSYEMAEGYLGGEDGLGHGGHAPDDGYPDDRYPDDEAYYDDDAYDEEFLPGMDPGRDRARGADGRSRGGSASRSASGRRPSGATRSAPASRGGGRAPRKRPMRRLAPWLALSVVLLLVGGVGGVGYHYWTKYLHPPDYSGSGTGSVVVHILAGETATAVGTRLQQLGVVESARAFGNAAKANPKSRSLEPGYYRVHKHMKASLALAMLLSPSSRVQTKVTIPEGLRVSQIIAKLGKATKDLRGYQAAIKDVKALDLPSFAKGKPEGYLYPATYEIQPGTSPTQVLKAMVTRFGQEAASVHLPAVAAHDEMTQAGIITVASLVQAEGRRVSDYPKIARVIYNRLDANPPMKLQLDSTVMYALHTYGIIASTKQTQVKSPYNTYLHAGLPPGPIDCPGNAAIKAALHPAPAKDGWLYFVTVNPKTGLTKFTSSPAVFQQLRAQLQKNVGQG